MLSSLHSTKGGKKAKPVHWPAESEAFALVIACAMLWAHRRSANACDFFEFAASRVLEAEATLQAWPHAIIVTLFQEKVMCGIGQKALRTYMQKEYGRKTVSHEAWCKEFVSNIVYRTYRFFASANAGTFCYMKGRLC